MRNRHLDMCKEILEAIEECEDFDDSFILDMMVKLEEGKFLSSGQKQAIHNIYDRWVSNER